MLGASRAREPRARGEVPALMVEDEEPRDGRGRGAGARGPGTATGNEGPNADPRKPGAGGVEGPRTEGQGRGARADGLGVAR
jgi:hypothetical protein